jgi:hypothetical protein
MTKFLLTFFIVVAGIGAYLWYDGSLSGILNSLTPPPQQAEIQIATTTVATSTPAPAPILPTSLDDTSDAALDTDIKAIDDQISVLQSDAAGMNSAIASSTTNQ